MMIFWRNLQQHCALQKETGLSEHICLFVYFFDKSRALNAKKYFIVFYVKGLSKWCIIFIKINFLGISLPIGRWALFAGKQKNSLLHINVWGRKDHNLKKRVKRFFILAVMCMCIMNLSDLIWSKSRFMLDNNQC